MTSSVKQKIGIPQIFKVSGVSFYQENVNLLKEDEIIKLEKDPKNKYDSNAIKILNFEGKMLGFVPKKYKLKNEEMILNELVLKKYNTVIMVDGYFWYHHQCGKYKISKNNKKFLVGEA